MTCGIYEIWIGENYYQGSSNDIERRIRQHKSALNKNNHNNTFMRNAYNKHKTFDYQVLVECPEHSLLLWEQDYIDANYGLPRYMNISPTANCPPSNKGKKHSAESKAKMSKTKKGKTFTDEHKANLSKASMGKPPTIGMTGKKHSAETRAKIGKQVICNGVVFPTQRALAKHLGVTVQTVSSWKKGRFKSPSHLNLTFTLPIREET